jgi:flagellar biosynthesis chaperone FliJ
MDALMGAEDIDGTIAYYERLLKLAESWTPTTIEASAFKVNAINNVKKLLDPLLEEYKTLDDMISSLPDLIHQSSVEVWQAAGRDISEGVTESLYASAADADWDGFKNAFTSKLKEAIISAAIGTSTIQEKVNEIIGRVMDDAKVTPEEISGALSELQGYYNEIEEQLAPLTTAIQEMTTEGVETTNSGTIIQQLSGGDRDFFAEQIKAAMAMVQQNLDFTGAAIQTINATQLIINSLTYNHEGNIIIQATEETDLKQFLSDLIGQAMGSA